MKLICLVLLSVFLSGCSFQNSYVYDEPNVLPSEKLESANTQKVQTQILENIKATILWQCESIETTSSQVIYDIYVVVNGKNQYPVKVETVLGTPYESDDSKMYPNDALAEISAWYAGMGVQYCVRQLDEKSIQIYKRSYGEGNPRTDTWENFECIKTVDIDKIDQPDTEHERLNDQMQKYKLVMDHTLYEYHSNFSLMIDIGQSNVNCYTEGQTIKKIEITLADSSMVNIYFVKEDLVFIEFLKYTSSQVFNEKNYVVKDGSCYLLTETMPIAQDKTIQKILEEVKVLQSELK